MIAPLAAALFLSFSIHSSEPPVPRELMTAAAELRKVAPLAREAEDQFIEDSINRTALRVFRHAAAPDRDKLSFAKRFMRDRIEQDRIWVDGSNAYCLNETLGRTFDLKTLQSMARTASAQGGRADWLQAIRGPAQFCYDISVSVSLMTSSSLMAIEWLADRDLIGRVPRYDPARGDAGFAADLEALCGRNARGAIHSRSGKLGLELRWVDRDYRRHDGAAYDCLSNFAMAAGHELVDFDT
jgi:hypothetical protein